MDVQQVAESKEQIVTGIENGKRYVNINDADVLLLTLLFYPDTYELDIVQLRDSPSQRLRPWALTYKKFDYEIIPLFKNLKRLNITNLETDNNSVRFVAQSKSIERLQLYHSNLNARFAKQLLKNKSLKTLELMWCDIDEAFITTLAKHKTIDTLLIDVAMGLDTFDEKEKARIMTALLKNEVLTHIELRTYTGHDKPLSRDYFTAAQDRQISERLQSNRDRLQSLMDVMPVLAGTQLGGHHRHAILDILPSIYAFMGREPPSHDESVGVSQQIEPIVQPSGVKRTFSELEDKPLPLMFKKL